MPTITSSPPRVTVAPKFDNGDEFLHSIGDVPMSRVIFNPLPGTATEEDLLRFVEKDKRLCELIDGTLVEKALGYKESRIAFAIAFALESFVRGKKLGIVSGPDATLRMSVGRIRLPDASFASVGDLPNGKRPHDKVPTLAPTIAIEVISDGNTSEEMRQKTREFFDSGSKLVWLVYPKTKTVAVFDQPTETPSKVISESDSLDGGTVLPGFSMSLSDIFAVSEFELE